MRLFLLSLLLIPTAYAVKCKIFAEVMYGDKNKAMKYRNVVGKLGMHSIEEQCSSCSTVLSWTKDRQEVLGLYTGECMTSKEKTQCEMHSHDNFVSYECVCSKDLCNEVQDPKSQWNELFGAKVGKGEPRNGKGELGNDVNPLADMFKCYTSSDSVMKGMEENEKIRKLREQSRNPKESLCFDEKQCKIEMKMEKITDMDMMSFSMGCAKEKGKSDGCEVSSDKMKATCYCSSNFCFTNSDGDAMMEELARSGTVSLNRGNSYPGGGIPGGNSGVGGAGVYSNGSPAIFTGPFVFIPVMVILAM